MSEIKTLSICIPTYNRSEQLKELVKSLLNVESQDFEVVITNNCSTDGTLKMLNGIKDDRLVVYNNQNPEPAYYNMILSIFNANGKYALYCNDRDVVLYERLKPFIEFLKNKEYSFLHIPKCYGRPSEKLLEFEKGFDSLIHHSFCDHPTGMVFNVELMKKHLKKENYQKYVQDVYTWCFLKRDLMVYEKTAVFDFSIWDERPSSFKEQSASGAIYKRQLFFETDKVIDFMKSVVAHLIGNPYFSFSPEQQQQLIIEIFISLSKRVIWKKRYYADKRECAHYGIKTRFVSYFEMRDSYEKYFEECDRVLKCSPYYKELECVWDVKKRTILKKLLFTCFRCDYSMLLIKLKRFLIPNYRF